MKIKLFHEIPIFNSIFLPSTYFFPQISTWQLFVLLKRNFYVMFFKKTAVHTDFFFTKVMRDKFHGENDAAAILILKLNYSWISRVFFK